MAHKVTNLGHDRTQLANIGRHAKEAAGASSITVLADRGYFSGEEVLACEAQDVVPICPKPFTSSGRKLGYFVKEDFRYEADRDLYLCPAGHELTQAKARPDRETDIFFYRNFKARQDCTIRSRRTPEAVRRTRRWENERVLDAMQHRLDRIPDAMRIRRQTVEHVFGTIKDWMGRSHFTTRRLPNVGKEMSIHILAYNMKRAIALLGTPWLITAMRR